MLNIFVSLMNNHFKHTHTHTNLHTPLVMLAQFSGETNTEKQSELKRACISFAPKLFFLDARHFLVLLTWFNLQVFRAAFNCRIHCCFWTFLPCVVILLDLQYVTANCHSFWWHLVICRVYKQFFMLFLPTASLFQRRVVICCFILRHLQLILLLQG